MGGAVLVLALISLVPLSVSLINKNYDVLYAFFISTLILMFCTSVILCIRPIKLLTKWLHFKEMTKQGEFLFIIAFVVFVPAFASLPVILLVPEIGYVGAYFEMVSALTTTGASLLVYEESYSQSLVLWRSLISAYGGLAIIVLSAAILSPRGFDGRSILPPGYRTDIVLSSLQNRIILSFQRYLYLYFGGLLVGCVAFMFAGNTLYSSILLAIAGIATCGFRIPSLDGGGMLELNHGSEIVLFTLMLYGAFLPVIMFWLTRNRVRKTGGLLQDPEIKLGASIIFIISGIIFLRHWLGAFEINNTLDIKEFYQAAWGILFTITSFLTTTGLESADWPLAKLWSGLANPTILLLFLSVVGGAASSNTGGIKLIRAVHLFHQSSNELSKLAMPNQVIKVKWAPYSLSTLQASLQITWVFFMLFIVVFAFGLCMLTLLGLTFESAIVVALSSLTNTGPALSLFSIDSLEYRAFRAPVQILLCLLMILGRIETLVFIAFLNPYHWFKKE